MIIIKRRDPQSVLNIEQDFHPVLKRIYASRSITQPDELKKDLKGLIPFTKLKGIEQATTLLAGTLMQQQRIMIIGDFDADGATSTAVAVTALRAMGAQQVNYLVPNRFEYGYGLTPEIVAVAAQWQPDLIITVDNGISSVEGTNAVKAMGANILITDHHLPGETLPDADAIVNPNQLGCEFPSKHLAGVGVIFYVMLALRSYLREQDWFKQQGITEPNLGQLLDLVALGTVADVVPLDKNNRILVHQGLCRIRAGFARPGIQALLTVGNRSSQQIVAQDLGFTVGPRLNAAGRLEDMSIGIVCLLSESTQEALALANRLDLLNQERKQIEAEMSQQAFKEIDKLQFNQQQVPAAISLYDSSWHQGVIGIVASRIKEKCHRPTVAFAQAEKGYIKGSARSINGIHIRDCLDAVATQHPDLIEKFGGHAMAAGLTIKANNFDNFQKVFAEEVAKHFSDDLAQGVVYSDGQLSDSDFNLSLAQTLKFAEPWGQAFPEPSFDGVFKLVEQRIVGAKHLKMILALPQSNQMIDAIAFNIDIEQWPNHRASHIHAVYRLDVNEFRGRRNLQLIIEHFTETTTVTEVHSEAEDIALPF